MTSSVAYFGLPNLKIGLATYFGNSQSTLFENDSTVVGIMMIGADFRYLKKGLQMRGQWVITNVSNTKKYNAFTGKDLGSKMGGSYLELGYDALSLLHSSSEQKLVLFFRWEAYNTHLSTAGPLEVNHAYYREEVTSGISWHIADGAVFKADYQLMNNEAILDRGSGSATGVFT